MDSIQQLTLKELIAIAYEHNCFQCLAELYESRKGGNYWACTNGCGRKCCDTCKESDDNNSGKSDEELEEEEMEGYVCEHCKHTA